MEPEFSKFVYKRLEFGGGYTINSTVRPFPSPDCGYYSFRYSSALNFIPRFFVLTCHPLSCKWESQGYLSLLILAAHLGLAPLLQTGEVICTHSSPTLNLLLFESNSLPHIIYSPPLQLTPPTPNDTGCNHGTAPQRGPNPWRMCTATILTSSWLNPHLQGVWRCRKTVL
ncbi:hypothetical protein BD779DRAFT_1524227 [Infundibulicybe gibba]|nr:hypothetical protein BD779DRAFT_1524227 [Infundibulicybe gibba]